MKRYGHHILRVVRRKLTKKMRTRFDSADFVQDVWASFFADPHLRSAYQRPEALVQLLASMAHKKVTDEFRRQLETQKRDLNREHSLDSGLAFQGGDVADPRPSPSRLISAKEQWNRLLQSQPDRYQRLLVMLGQGDSPAEIARQLGLNEKTVRRLVRRINPERFAPG
jgi:RNA polymerase sigma-70 factor (ECF subfamily)